MDAYRLDDHTADAKLVVYGTTKESLFQQGLLGVYDFMEPALSDVVAPTVTLELRGRDTTQLLVDFLSNVVTWSYINKSCYKTFTLDSLTNTSLTATLTGKLVKCFGKDLKAITHHKAYVKAIAGGFEAAVIFDI